MRRQKMPRRKDARIFKRTATRTKAINVGVGIVPRGGTRL